MSTLVSKANKQSCTSERYSTNSVCKKQSSIDSKRIIFYDDRPRPIDFDNFLPWVCLEMQVPNFVVVTRMNQEKLAILRRSSSIKSKSTKNIRAKPDYQESCNMGHLSNSNTIVTSASAVENIIPVTAYYDPYGHLVEIAIDSCKTKIPRKVITAIGFCLPFHSFLNKLIIRKGGMYSSLITEIEKLLVHSHLTDVCLDDTYIPEGNYYTVLEQASNLKHLSVCRCKINDAVSKEIFLRLDYGQPSEKSLMLLDLSSNIITDIGAKTIGEMLRKNRHLLHLNLAANLIGDEGLAYIMNSLSLFPLTYDEAIDRKRKIFEYTKMKFYVLKKLVTEVPDKIDDTAVQDTIPRLPVSIKQMKFKKCKNNIKAEELSPEAITKKKIKEILGELSDPFDSENVIKKDGYCYCLGNLKLCSLNMSYNKLMFASLVKILNVLKYQFALEKKPEDTGIMRIVLDGNPLPESCYELEMIEKYLTKAIAAKTPVLTIPVSPLIKKRGSTSTVKHR